MITALPVPSVKVFHKTYYHEKSQRAGNSQPGSPLSDAALGIADKNQLEYYFCGKINALHVVVSSPMLGAILLVVGLVQLSPRAEAEQYATILICTGCGLILLGAVLAYLRALWIKRRKASEKESAHQRSVSSIDMLLAQHRDFTVLTPDELEDLVGRQTPANDNKIRKQGHNT